MIIAKKSPKLVLTMGASILFADSSPPAPSTPEVWKMYSFPGIQTDYTSSLGTRVSSTVRPIESQLGDVRAKVGQTPAEKEILVGHSQGGVRALAFARLLENQGKVGAVITVNSPVRGHSGLDNSYAVMKRKLVEATWPVLDGLYAASEGSLVSGMFLWGSLASVITTAETVYLKNTIGTNKGQYSAFLEQLPTNPAVRDAVGKFTGLPSVPGTLSDLWGTPSGIRDLAPGSAFMQKYVDPGTAPLSTQGTFYQYQVGTLQSASVHWVHHSVWWWSWDSPEGIDYSNTPVYKYAYVRVSSDAVSRPTPLYPTATKLDPGTPVGFIQGTNNSVDKFMRDSGYSGIQPQATMTNMKGGFLVINNGLMIAGAVWFTAACVLLAFGLFVFALTSLLFAFVCNNYATRVRGAMDSLDTLVSTLLGSSSHDGLIPTGDQWRPLDGVGGIGGSPLTKNIRIPYIAFNTTHESARTDPRIWGVGGGIGWFDVKVTPTINAKAPVSTANTPLVRQWINSVIPDPANPPPSLMSGANMVGGGSFAP